MLKYILLARIEKIIILNVGRVGLLGAGAWSVNNKQKKKFSCLQKTFINGWFSGIWENLREWENRNNKCPL